MIIYLWSMVKKITSGLIILMGNSIVGIIIVQLIWMDNAIRLRNEQFDRGVSDAMHQTVNRMEKIHDITVISHLAFPDSMGRFSITRFPPGSTRVVAGVPSPAFSNMHTTTVYGKRNLEKVEIEVKEDSGKVIHYKMSKPPDPLWVENKGAGPGHKMVILNKDTLKNYDVFFDRGLMALDSIKIVMDSSEIGGGTIRKKISVRAQKLRNLAERAVTEIKVLDNPNIDRRELEKVLTEELKSRKILLPYQYGIMRDSTLIMSSEKPDTVALMSAPYRCELYPNIVFRRNFLLSVFFPTRDRYILTTIGWLLGTSFLFSMIILIAFSFSVFFLLRQKKISKMKADFINNMTHEFKTPIATISVASDSILDEKVIRNREKVAYFVSMIKKENQRMNRQVEDILTIARLEKKELEFKWEMVNIHEIIAEVCDVIRVQVEQRNGVVSEDLKAGRPVILADRQHISHMIFNLLDNANKYSPENPEIMVQTSDNDQGLLLSISDKGIGMTRQVLGRIFERFYRQPSGNVHNVKGFGLGLSYVKAVVEAHKGSVSVDSEPGKGSTFYLFLPFKHNA
jgi:two-component system, OmpR family, phosphate regulon sensor histidine kinase PhoR